MITVLKKRSCFNILKKREAKSMNELPHTVPHKQMDTTQNHRKNHMFSNIRLFVCACALVLSFSLQAITIPQAEKDSIIQDVLTEYGRYEAAEVERRIRLWILDQSEPPGSGQVVTQSGCSGSCPAPTDGNINYPSPREVSFIGKINNADLSQNFMVQWKRPVNLPSGSDYTLDHYLVFLNKDNSFYSIYSVDGKFKSNGRPLTYQHIQLKNLPKGTYYAQIRAVYSKPSSSNQNSFFTSSVNDKVNPINLIVGDISDADFRQCVLDNGYLSTTPLANVTHLDCSNRSLVDDDLMVGSININYLVGLKQLNLSDNNFIVITQELGDLPFLTWLDLSGNPNIISYSFTIPGLDTLIMRNSQVSNLITFNSTPTFIDMSDNSIGFGLSNLPDSVDYLILNNNAASPNFSELAGKRIEILELKNSTLTDVSVLSGIMDLKYLTLDGSNLDPVQDINSYTGFCGLSIKDTDIEKLKGKRPIKALDLSNNSILRSAEAYIGSTFYIPEYLNFSDSNSLACNHYYKTLDNWNSMSKVNMTTPYNIDINGDGSLIEQSPICPSNSSDPTVFIQPDYCKPNEPSSLEVYQDQSSSKRYFKWNLNQNFDYERWGASNVLVVGKNANGEIVSSDSFEFSEPFGQTNNLAAASYEISICTPSTCGYKRTASSVSMGLTTPVEETVELIGSGASKAYRLLFRYPNEEFNGGQFSKPEYFKVTALYAQTSGISQSFTIPVTGNDNYNYPGNWWASNPIGINDYVGNSFNIQACNSLLGCSEGVTLAVQTQDVDTALPSPQWVSISAVNGDEKRIKLQWNFGAGNTEDIDYVKISESQPLIHSDHTVGTDSKSETTIEYYTDEISEPLILNRSVKGVYEFELFSCKRNRVTGDVCSPSSEEYAFNTPDYEIKRLEVILEPDPDNPTAQGPAVLRHPRLFRIQGNTFYWRNTFPTVSQHTIKPDYFHIQNTINGNGCMLSKSDGTNDVLVQEFTVEAIKFSLGADGTSGKRCKSIIGDEHWQIRACVHGAGCTHVVGLDPQFTRTPASEPPEAKGNVDNIIETFNPGIWVHPESASSGWYFFWANSQARAEAGEYPLHGSNYDLIGYWFTYKQDEVTGYWTPVWYWTRMIKEDPNQNVYSGDILKQKFIPGPTSQVDDEFGVGHAILNLDVGSEVEGCGNEEVGRCTSLEINAQTGQGLLTHITNSDELGPYTMGIDADNGHVKLIIKDFTIGIMDCQEDGSIDCGNRFGLGNDIDHYSGVWQSEFASGSLNPKVTMLTWIERDLEFTTVATFDNAGEPIWVVGQSCNSETCKTPIAGPSPGSPNSDSSPYLDLHPNDTVFTKNVYWVTNAPAPLKGYPYDYNQHNEPAGLLLRAYSENISIEDDDFNKARIDVEIVSDWRYQEGNNIDTNTRSVDVSTSYRNLVKQANFHGINFTVPEGNWGDDPFTGNTVEIDPNICDPTLENGVGGCYIRFNWYTDANYDVVEPFYSFNGGSLYKVFKDNQSDPDSPLDCTRQPTEVNVNGLVCLITQAGYYDFRLMKPTYCTGSCPTQNIAIAKSDTLLVLPCNGNANCDPNVNPDSIGEYTPISGEPLSPDEVATDVHTISHSEGSGPIPGSGSVSGGSATYNIPMVIPPGRNGMVPELSVNYSSRGGNGIMGVGWSVSMGSTLSRCAKTVAQDGVNETITLDNRDRLCLDGERLMLESTENNSNSADIKYWANDTEYRTEMNSFARITKILDSRYTVETKSGLKLTYRKQGNDPLNWYLTDERDTFGNYIEYTYQEHGANEWLLDKVYYSGNHFTRGTRSIEFSYSDRGTDYNKTYLWGDVFERSQKLDSITTKVNGSQERVYSFQYVNSPANDALLLEKVFEQAGSVTREIAVNEWSNSTWQANTAEYSYSNIAIDAETKKLLVEAQISSDFNGDGIKEYLIFPRRPGYQGLAKMIFFDSSGALQKVLNFSEQDSNFNRWVNVAQPGDLDADGYTDLVLNDGGLKIFSWKNGMRIDDANAGNSVYDFFDTDTTAIDYRWLNESEGTLLDRDVSKVYFMDFNNDGKQDVVMEKQPLISNSGGFVGPARLVWYPNTTQPEYENGTSGAIASDITFGLEQELLTTQPYGDLEGEEEVRFILWNKIVSIEDFNGDSIPDVYMRRVSAVSVNPLEEIIPQVRQHTIAFMVHRDDLINDDICPNAQVQYCAIEKEVSSLGLDDLECEKTDGTIVDCIEKPPTGVSVANVRSVNPMDMISYKFHDVNGDGLKDLLYYNLAYVTLTINPDTNIARYFGQYDVSSYWKVRLNTGGEINNSENVDYEIFDSIDIESDPSNIANAAFIPQASECAEAFSQSSTLSDARKYEVRRLCHTVFRSASEFNDINGDGIGEMLFPGADKSSLLFNHCNILTAAPIDGGSTRSFAQAEVAYDVEDEFDNETYISADEQVRLMSESSLATQLDLDPFIQTVNDGFPSDVGDNQCFDSVCIDTIPQRANRGGGGAIQGPRVAFSSCSADHSDIVGAGVPNITYYDPFTSPDSQWNDPLYILSTGSATRDAGLYRFKAIEFRLKANGGLGMELIEDTGFYKTLQGSHMGDVTGDGLLDDYAPAGCTVNSQAGFCDGSQLYDGRNVSGLVYPDNKPEGWNIAQATLTQANAAGISLLTKNESEMPNMLTSVTKPKINQWVSWVYSPISGGSDIYTVEERSSGQEDGYLDSAGVSGEYFYFNSSMYVVAEMLQSNGLDITGGIHGSGRGDGYETTSYEYEGAVYNNAGRGFQGFRKITVTNSPKPDDNTFATKSVSTFHQVFPKAGKLEKIETYKISEPGNFPVSIGDV